MAQPDYIAKHRLDALIDAVIAITMTLLVLELRVPEDLHEGLMPALRELQPKFISWVVSFLILALLWRGHMRATRDVEHVDFRFFVVTVLWLLLTSLLPFTSSLIGEHNELFSSHVAYGVNLIAIEFVVLLRDLHLSRHPELGADGRAGKGSALRQFLPVTLCAAISMAMASQLPDYASLPYLLLVVLVPWSMRARRQG